MIKTLFGFLVRKRDGDADLLEGDAAYKGRRVVDGANEKSSAVAAGKEIFTFHAVCAHSDQQDAVCPRMSTAMTYHQR